MEDRLRKYIDGLFVETAPTKKAVELKEEMIQNLTDKYSDLINEGKTPEAAYNVVVAGIGDVSALLNELEADYMTGNLEARRHKSAMFTSIAVVIYILSVLPLIMLAEFGVRNSSRIGLPVMFIMIAGATGLIIYTNMTKPRNLKPADTMVEEFREWQENTHYRKSLRRSISAALWSLIIAVYFIISFWTFAWHISWIIFLLGAALESVINIFFSFKK